MEKRPCTPTGGGKRCFPRSEAMDREIEYLQQQIQYLERALETCMAHISSLEARVAELERRPVALPPPAKAPEGGGKASYVEGMVAAVESTGTHRWVTLRAPEKPGLLFPTL